MPSYAKLTQAMLSYAKLWYGMLHFRVSGLCFVMRDQRVKLGNFYKHHFRVSSATRMDSLGVGTFAVCDLHLREQQNLHEQQQQPKKKKKKTQKLIVTVTVLPILLLLF